MQVKDVIPETFGLFKKQLERAPFQLSAEESDHVTELEALFMDNHAHFTRLPFQKNDPALLDCCVNDFKKLQMRSRQSKSLKVAAIGSVYLAQAYLDYAVGHKERLGTTRMKNIEAMYKNAEKELSNPDKIRGLHGTETQHAVTMMKESFDSTWHEILNPPATDKFHESLRLFLSGKQTRKVS